MLLDSSFAQCTQRLLQINIDASLLKQETIMVGDIFASIQAEVLECFQTCDLNLAALPTYIQEADYEMVRERASSSRKAVSSMRKNVKTLVTHVKS